MKVKNGLILLCLISGVHAESNAGNQNKPEIPKPNHQIGVLYDRALELEKEFNSIAGNIDFNDDKQQLTKEETLNEVRELKYLLNAALLIEISWGEMKDDSDKLTSCILLQQEMRNIKGLSSEYLSVWELFRVNAKAAATLQFYQHMIDLINEVSKYDTKAYDFIDKRINESDKDKK
jgi:hypothetical protein